MSTSAYTGWLTDVGVSSLAGLTPRLTVRPEVEAYGPNGLVSSHRVEIPVTGTSFAMTLIPSNELTPARGGGAGVKYIIETSLFAKTQNGQDWEVWNSEWHFAALPGGGAIKDMGDVPPVRFMPGPPWPSTPTPGMFYDTTDGDLSSYGIGG